MMADIVKAGWLFRRTTVLKNWKREWFILTNDARLRRISDPVKQFDKADDVFQLSRCRELNFGAERVPHNIDPPRDATRAQLMQLVPSEGDPWALCAESTDDLLAWQTSFNDVRQLYIERLQQQQTQYNSTRLSSRRYDCIYYSSVYPDDFSQHIYYTPNGSTQTIILVDRDPRCDAGSDIATGAFISVAIGTCMLLPFLMLPLLLC
ncbi:unnamed protein product [Rotaria socialis]|uniref:PH domain-containing protein n=2 Tax=Rotaria socialis TaxID=392032 RepID=A0A818C7N4_9BILA|nr:unnamed protein product [Rotaria socialis]CAF4463748.1 unnamed protein product [Rotaria socialis]